MDLTTTGNVTDTLTGNLTKSISGPVDITASAGVNITTPSWKVNVTGVEKWWIPHTEKVTGFRLNGTISSLDAWGIRAQGYLVNFQAAVMKMDHSAFKDEKAYAAIKTSAVYLGKQAVRVGSSALRLAKSGLHIFF